MPVEDQRENSATEKVKEGKQNISLSTQFCLDLILQTILVSLEVKWNKRTLRAIIDTGSQLSYGLKKTALEIGCQPVKYERVIHSLFGGSMSKRMEHPCYDLPVDRCRRCHSDFPFSSWTTNKSHLTELGLLGFF